MSDPRGLVFVTFIAGSANLTQRVLRRDEIGDTYDVAVMPTVWEGVSPVPTERVHARRERYRIRQVSRDHYVALYEHLA